MARVTSKLQVTIPKAIAVRYGIAPGTDLDWLEAGDAIRVVPPSAYRQAVDRERRVELFDAATARERARGDMSGKAREASDRGWTREGLYERGSSD
jgi:AbrB family looped-hinge helix DNA binding protein